MRRSGLLAMILVFAAGCQPDGGAGSAEQETTTTTSSSGMAMGRTASGTEGVASDDTSEATAETSDEDSLRCAELAAAVEAVVTAYQTDLALVGLSVSYEAQGCPPENIALGRSSLAPPQDLTTDHVLRAGSVTKTFTSALVLKLAEEGLLTLDDTLMDWGYDDVQNAAVITVRQLLNHTSGLNDYQFNPAFMELLKMDPDRVWTPEELIGYAIELDPVSAPGDGWAYSNANYILVGRIVEQATGQSYARALRERVLEPLGLQRVYVEGGEDVPDLMATGYIVPSTGTPQDTTGFYHASQAWSAGAVSSTASDLRMFIATLLGSDFLTPESQAELATLVPTGNSLIDAYGLGIFSLQHGALTAFGHNGAVMGFQASAAYHPQSRASTAVLQNQMTLDATGNLAGDPTVLALDVLEVIAE